MARAGIAEFFGAFDGAKPVGFAGLLMDRETLPDGRVSVHGYLGWTGTDPEHRGRGAQSALIAARLARAAALGAHWCVSETNTAADASLRNLLRAGFTPAAEWAVYRWDADPKDQPETTA
jgi:GNAT superfamily N-acetyltransferase